RANVLLCPVGVITDPTSTTLELGRAIGRAGAGNVARGAKLHRTAAHPLTAASNPARTRPPGCTGVPETSETISATPAPQRPSATHTLLNRELKGSHFTPPTPTRDKPAIQCRQTARPPSRTQ